MSQACVSSEICECVGCSNLKKLLDDPDLCDRTEFCECRECEASRQLMARIGDRTADQDAAYEEAFEAWREERCA